MSPILTLPTVLHSLRRRYHPRPYRRSAGRRLRGIETAVDMLASFERERRYQSRRGQDVCGHLRRDDSARREYTCSQ
jgi:hypothetical protein